MRAFDARTGKLRWAWDPVPPGYVKRPGQRYARGTPNVWSFLSADPERDLRVRADGQRLARPLRRRAPRPRPLRQLRRRAARLDGRARLALPDRAPRPLGLRRARAADALRARASAGGRVPALAQITKMGHLFLLDRETGEPLFPVEERPGARRAACRARPSSPTQPFPTHPRAAPPGEARRPRTPSASRRGTAASAPRRSAALRNEGIFTPPRLEGSILFPSNAGGPNWGGVSIDPRRGRLYVNQMRIAGCRAAHARAPSTTRCRRKQATLPRASSTRWRARPTRRGAGRCSRRSARRATRRPGACSRRSTSRRASCSGRSRLGTTRDQAPFPMWLPLGAPNLGGSLATAGGLVFIGATTDKFLRAFDADTGAEIWRTRLPYTANATPMSYRLRPERKPVRRRRRRRPRLVRARRRRDGLRASERGRSRLITGLPFGHLTEPDIMELFTAENALALLTLTALEVVLGHRQPGRDRDPDGQAPARSSAPAPGASACWRRWACASRCS